MPKPPLVSMPLKIANVCVATLAICTSAQATPRDDAVRVWDTGKAYTQKNPMGDAFGDRANWKLVPYEATDYRPKGDLIVENEYFYLFLFTNKEDSIDLMAKMGPDGFKPNEVHKVHQDEHGLRNFGHGTMWVELLRLAPEEMLVKHAGEGHRHGTRQPVVTRYRILAGKP